MLFIFMIVVSIFLYIQSSKIAGNHSLPNSMYKFTKDLYHGKGREFNGRNFCEIIHIGVVCSGFTSNVYFHALLKSLFMTRSNPIHFHLLVSNESETVLRSLFKTWQMPQVNISFYKMDPWLKHVRWVPNGHYSGNYGLLKLIFNKVVPFNVTKKLLVLDTDIIVNDDIFMLWKLFENFSPRQVIGIGENQSPYYLGQLNKENPWPALGTGFNTGVMLFDLEKLNSIKWDSLWANLTKRLTVIYGQADLGDQDIINSIIVENPDIIYKLPCYWNTQMSSHSTSSSCYSRFKPKIIHWNSPKKFTVPSKDGELFRGLSKSVFELNGDWFRRYPQLCEDNTRLFLNIESNDECRRFSKPSDKFYRTLLFFLDYKFITDDWDITYVTHLSFDRIHLMENIAKMWKGPISFTLYVSDEELTRAMELIVELEALNSRTDIAYHAVFKQGEFYPTNTLRNTGLKYVRTPYVFLVDIDFIPMKSLFEILKDNIRSTGDLDRKALVVPAFEATKTYVDLPKNKIELMEALGKKEVRQFLAESWPDGHGPTDYEKWRREYEPYEVKWRAHYEPYIVVQSDVVPYDERFLGFGWNKASHIMELEAQNYNFIVLSDVFIIHEQHATSFDNMRYKKSHTYRKCVQLLKRRFIQELQKKYNINFLNISFSGDIDTRRKKRSAEYDSTTSLYDSTDYFLAWGGKEKAERKKEPKRITFSNPKRPENKTSFDYDYYYYNSTRPYNLTVLKIRVNSSGFNGPLANTNEVVQISSEEHDYEYDEEDLKFKRLHDSTTLPTVEDNSTILAEKDLIPHEKNLTFVGRVDEKLKNVTLAL